ncbi:MAG: hypothetical protein RL329_1800 [Bacteroidota bacterium]
MYGFVFESKCHAKKSIYTIINLFFAKFYYFLMKLGTIGTRMTPIGQIFTDFISYLPQYILNKNLYKIKKSVKIRPIGVICVPIVSHFMGLKYLKIARSHCFTRLIIKLITCHDFKRTTCCPL